MKISYITSARVPSERAYGYAIPKLCEEWALAGHDVELVLPDRKYGIQQSLFEYYGLKSIFSVRSLKTSDLVGRRPGASKFLFMLDLAAFMAALVRCRFARGSIIYTREYLLALILPKENLFLELHTIHGHNPLFRRALSRARGIITISAGIREELLKMGIPPSKILVAHDGADLTVFENIVVGRDVWQEFGIDPSKKIVLYTGHFYEWKGADTLAKAASFLPPDIHVVLMGGVDKELEQFKKEYADPNVSILPQQPRQRIPGFLKNADVLVLPNSAKAEISRAHASPLKLFEYMASGRPILASDVPSLREILDEHTAAFFAPDDASALARTLQEVLVDGQALAGRARAALDKVQQYSWAARARHIADFLSGI